MLVCSCWCPTRCQRGCSSPWSRPQNCCGGDVALTLDVTMTRPPTASKMLCSARLVQTRRDGRVIFYPLADGFQHQLLAQLSAAAARHLGHGRRTRYRHSRPLAMRGLQPAPCRGRSPGRRFSISPCRHHQDPCTTRRSPACSAVPDRHPWPKPPVGAAHSSCSYAAVARRTPRRCRTKTKVGNTDPPIRPRTEATPATP